MFAQVAASQNGLGFTGLRSTIFTRAPADERSIGNSFADVRCCATTGLLDSTGLLTVERLLSGCIRLRTDNQNYSRCGVVSMTESQMAKTVDNYVNGKWILLVGIILAHSQALASAGR